MSLDELLSQQSEENCFAAAYSFRFQIVYFFYRCFVKVFHRTIVRYFTNFEVCIFEFHSYQVRLYGMKPKMTRYHQSIGRAILFSLCNQCILASNHSKRFSASILTPTFFESGSPSFDLIPSSGTTQRQQFCIKNLNFSNPYKLLSPTFYGFIVVYRFQQHMTF
jgi:hypothetical protein